MTHTTDHKSQNRQAKVSRESLRRAEAALAEAVPFGNPDYIDRCTWTRYGHRLRMIAAEWPVATRLLAAIETASPECCRRVLGDPAVRGAINAAVAHFRLHFEGHLDELESVLAVAIDHLKAGRLSGPLENASSLRLGPAGHHGWIWNEGGTDGPVRHYYRQILHDHVPTVVLQDATVAQNQILVDGTALLDALLPRLSASALTHLHVVAVCNLSTAPGVDARTGQSQLISLIEYYYAGFTSLTQTSVLGTIFLAPCVLHNPWQAAEFLLHEALHNHFVDLEHTHGMLRRGYQEEHSPKISVPWNRSRPGMPNEWPMNRCMSVMHVYVAIALFFSALVDPSAALVERYGPPHVQEPLYDAQRAVDRAHYLAEQMKLYSSEMGPAGQRFVDWMLTVLDSLNLCAPAAEPTLHLLLDLYDREVSEVEEWLQVAKTPLHPSIWKLINDAIQAELTGLVEIYATLGEVLPAFKGVSPLEPQTGPEQLATVFRTVRTYVSAALTRLDPLVQRSGSGPSHRELVLKLVETSGRYINQIVHRPG